jgi:hypothetical protein
LRSAATDSANLAHGMVDVSGLCATGTSAVGMLRYSNLYFRKSHNALPVRTMEDSVYLRCSKCNVIGASKRGCCSGESLCDRCHEDRSRICADCGLKRCLSEMARFRVGTTWRGKAIYAYVCGEEETDDNGSWVVEGIGRAETDRAMDRIHRGISPVYFG